MATIFEAVPQTRTRTIAGSGNMSVIDRMATFGQPPVTRLDPAANARGVESHRSNGGRADLDRPVTPGAAANYGLRPLVMDPFLPDFEKYQRTRIE